MNITTPTPTTVERLTSARNNMVEARNALIAANLTERPAAVREYRYRLAIHRSELADAHRRAGL